MGFSVDYPQALPLDDLGHLITAIRERMAGKPHSESHATLAHHGWCVAGYGLHLSLGDGQHGPPVIGSKLTHFLRWVWPIIKMFLAKLLPDVFGSQVVMGEVAALDEAAQLAKLDEFLAMPDDA